MSPANAGCPACAEEIEGSDAFCRFCGHDLGSAMVPRRTGRLPDSAKRPRGDSPPKLRSGGKKLLIVGLIGLIASGAVLGTKLYLDKRAEDRREARIQASIERREAEEQAQTDAFDAAVGVCFADISSALALFLDDYDYWDSDLQLKYGYGSDVVKFTLGMLGEFYRTSFYEGSAAAWEMVTDPILSACQGFVQRGLI